MSIHLNNAKEVLAQFTPISLNEMDGVKLMRRVDTKFVFDSSKICQILEDASKNYRVLEIDTERALKYETMYYDTDKFDMYIKHHNGLLNRHKVRSRKYLISDIEFLEVKYKNNKGETIKTRVKHALDNPFSSKENQDFIDKSTPFTTQDLKPVMKNYFSRITLVHHTVPERVTLDLNLAFHNVEAGNMKMVPGICIAEVKREMGTRSSEIVKILKNNKIYPMGFSKYCMGSALVNKNLKYNRFKPRLNKMQRFERGLIYA